MLRSGSCYESFAILLELSNRTLTRQNIAEIHADLSEQVLSDWRELLLDFRYGKQEAIDALIVREEQNAPYFAGQMGMPAERLSLSSVAAADEATDEVWIYVR